MIEIMQIYITLADCAEKDFPKSKGSQFSLSFMAVGLTDPNKRLVLSST